jgi:hypothetical protein
MSIWDCCREIPLPLVESLEVFLGDPGLGFISMPFECPSPECFPKLGVNVLKDPFAGSMFVVVSPTTEDRIEVPDDCFGGYIRMGF